MEVFRIDFSPSMVTETNGMAFSFGRKHTLTLFAYHLYHGFVSGHDCHTTVNNTSLMLPEKHITDHGRSLLRKLNQFWLGFACG